MPEFPPARIRNVAVVGHAGSGKTTLVESLLATSGAIPRMGRVEDGSTVSDFEPEEHRRSLSIATTWCPFTWTPHVAPGSPPEQPHRINLLDCPGEPDLFAHVAAALRVADLALFVVSAADGVQAGTEQAWRAAEELGLPRMFFVNKCDRERADAEGAIDALREVFGAGVAPLELPIGAESSFVGVVDLLSDIAEVYEDGQGTTQPVPAEMEVTEHEVHDQLVEGIVVADDDLMTRYLEGDVPSVEELEKALARGVDDGVVFPVVLGSALKRIAVDRLADFLCEIGPSPLDRPPVVVEAGDTLAEVPCDPKGPPLAVVWRTIDDRFQGKLSVARCLSGTITPDTTVRNTRSGAEEKLHTLLALRGAQHEPVGEVVAGDLFAVPKLTATLTGDTLAAKDKPVRVPWPEEPPPSFEIAIAPRSKGDDDKLMIAIHRLTDEDPALRVRRDEETHQTVLGGRGETHVQIALERLKRKFSVEVDTHDLVIPFRETINASATAEGRYKKQTGGHGQYGVCTLVVEPLERGKGFEFVDQIVGGAIPRNLIPAVEKGVLETMESGGVYGYPVVDVRVRCVDGKYHSVDSSEMSFKMAGSLAFREAMAKAAPVVLEPISTLRVTVPADLQGDILGDLNARRGRVQDTDVDERGHAVITALVPAAELTRYAVELRSMTGARGRFEVQHSHYDPLPAHLAEKLPKKGD